jgi:uncharacterized lipoprotein YddW (UPF0748 family)
MMKKIIASLMMVLLMFTVFSINANATPSLIPLAKADGSGYVTYRGKTTQVMIPTEYTVQSSEFRAVWVSPLVNDISGYINDAVFKTELLSVLDNMEYFNLNVIVFHVRIMNDALYDTRLNPKSSYISGANFEKWDYLKWFIGECHRRGIEFHAWLNPYRITNKITTMSGVTGMYAKYPLNPASKAQNVLITNKGAILNPGEPAVRDFVVRTCMEVIQKYDVDAIHFDDYFYAEMPGDADKTTYEKYKVNSSTTNLNDWRREQVDLFIEDLSKTIRQYNRQNNRQVQLGIAPTGIWKNGNGVVEYDAAGTAITTGSNTAGQEHYASYLFCNTKKWVDEEWIDYIVPQTYWSFELPAAPYADVVDWWAKVVKYKDVNLYTGMGLYRRYDGDSGRSWETNPLEASNQVLYNTKFEEIQGTVIFNYRYLKQSKTIPGMAKIVSEYWNKPTITPVVRTMTPVIPNAVSDVKIAKNNNSYVLNWHESTNAKKYAIYRSEGDVDVNDPTQQVGLVGKNANNDIIYVDKVDTSKNYNYAIVAVSGTSSLSEPTLIDSKTITDVDFKIGEFDDLIVSGKIFPNERVIINFYEANLYAGNPLTYELQYTLDNENWIVVQPSAVRISGNRYSYQFYYSPDAQPIYFKVIGRNEFGELVTNIVPVTVQIEDFREFFDLTFYLFNERLNDVLNH